MDKARLKQSTLALIGRVRQLHSEGGGSLSVSDLVELVGFTFPAEVVGRGELALVALNAQSGTFEQCGTRSLFSQRGLRIEVPDRVAGRYRLDGSRLSLQFDADATVVGKKLFVRAVLRGLSADEHGFEIDIQSPVPIPGTRIVF